ncbi:LOW QUALITY PROTEIN: MSS51 Protein MSS51 [Candida maltosa Xu316]
MLNMDDSKTKVKERPLYNWDESPHEDIRERAALIRAKALCPVTSKPVDFVCPYSGIPTHHSKEAWEQDKEYHDLKKYEKLKKVNLYEHDLRSGRQFTEFVFPKEQERDFMVNVSDWDSFFYTRDFPPMNDEFNLAAATKVLTYPITIASVLHKYSPFVMEPKGPLTVEGAKSLGALRYTLYPPQLGKTSTTSTNSSETDSEVVFKDRAMRIFIIGPRMESLLPGYIWKQFQYLFPNQEFEIHLVGPEANYDKKTQKYTKLENTDGRAVVERVDPQLSIHKQCMYWEDVFAMGDLYPFDPYLDCFFLFHPNFDSADSIHWEESIKGLLETKCPIIITGYNQKDIEKDYKWVTERFSEDLDVLMNETENPFSCTKYEILNTDPTNTLQLNNKIFGKRYYVDM